MTSRSRMNGNGDNSVDRGSRSVSGGHGSAASGTTPVLDHDRPTDRRLLPVWFPEALVPINDDIDTRIVLPGREARWMPTAVNGISVRIFDFIGQARGWVTGELLIEPGAPRADLHCASGGELFVRSGKLVTTLGVLADGQYLRLPPAGDAARDYIAIAECAPMDQPTRVYFTLGQMLRSDAELRNIDTREPSRWLPGPESGTEVQPLHGHGRQVSMLVRWSQRATFQPRIDPQGEEVLVLAGNVGDAWGDYAQHSWIRNPADAWQAWRGDAGTLIFYKSGHLAEIDP